MSSYFDRSSSWVFDKEGNYLYTDSSNGNPNEIREGYFFYDYEEQMNEEYRHYEEQKEKQKSQSSEKSCKEI